MPAQDTPFRGLGDANQQGIAYCERDRPANGRVNALQRLFQAEDGAAAFGRQARC
jgi:hypothetical protein